MQTILEEMRNKKILFVASTGGHLAQLRMISERISPDDNSLWVTFDSAQSRSLLRGKRKVLVDYIAPRDYRAVLRSIPKFRSILKNEQFDVVLTTGAAIALGIVPQAILRNLDSLYIESVSRYDGPSLTGKIMRLLPKVQLRTQHSSWASRNWIHEFSVMDSFYSDTITPQPRSSIRYFVTLGTIRPYRFDRMVDEVLEILQPADEVTWQVGITDRDDLPGDVRSEMSSHEFDNAVMEADIVVTHAGVGTLMKLIELNAHVVTLPRYSRFNEHVDDHQNQVARDFEVRELAVVCRPGELTISSVHRARELNVGLQPTGSIR